MLKVTLHVRSEPYEEKDDKNVTTLDGNKVIGEVKLGDEVLHSKTVITEDTIESVCGVKESVTLDIELWAVMNTNFMPTADAMPS